MRFFDFLSENLKDIFFELKHHLLLALLPTLCALVIAILLAILLSKFEKASGLVESLTGIFRTVPLISTYALMIYFFGVGYFACAIIIFIYAIFPIAKQTHIGLRRITSKKIKAIKKMGLNNWQIVSLVRIPICLPYVIDGLRIALVRAIVMVMLAAYFGSGGLGVYVFRGIAVDDINAILIGTIFVILLGLIVNYILLGLQSLVTARGLNYSQKVEDGAQKQ
jgi:osmoprotectant transport system permease protein